MKHPECCSYVYVSLATSSQREGNQESDLRLNWEQEAARQLETGFDEEQGVGTLGQLLAPRLHNSFGGKLSKDNLTSKIHKGKKYIN